MANTKQLTIIVAAVGGIGILAAAGAWTTSTATLPPVGSGARPPTPAKARRAPPAPAKPTTLSEAEAEYLFRSVLLQRQQESIKVVMRCGNRGPWLEEDLHSDGPIARLFARTYPDLCKRLIMELLEDPEAPRVDRNFALDVLGSLPGWTSDRLEELLREMVANSDEYYQAHFPLLALAHRDRDMRHRDLYHGYCREGNPAAFQILRVSVHSTSLDLFKQLAKGSRERYYPLGSIPDEAEQALGYLAILQSKDWKETVETFITTATGKHEDFDNFFWACEVAGRRNLPEYIEWLAKRARSERKPQAWYGNDLQDHALVMFAQEGGELTPDEFTRLRENGFVGDPEERLLQILRQPRIR